MADACPDPAEENRPMTDAEELDAAVVALYAQTPDAFTSARDLRAREAPPALAARIKKIRKPTVAAWAVDLLAREGGLTEALDLGERLREAQDELDAAELAALGRQRRQLVAALARDAVERAGRLGVAVSAAARDDVAATLNAALLDAETAVAVASGRLVRTFAAGDEVDLAEVLSGSVPTARPAAPARDDLAERRAKRAAEAEAREARRAAERTERARVQAAAQRDRAQSRLDERQARVETLRRDLAHAEDELAAAKADFAEATAAWTEASDAATAAARRARGDVPR
jgi:hypothetical protein